MLPPSFMCVHYYKCSVKKLEINLGEPLDCPSGFMTLPLGVGVLHHPVEVDFTIMTSLLYIIPYLWSI